MTTPSENKALPLKAFDTLFNRRDYEAAKRYWSNDYIQHRAHIPQAAMACLVLFALFPARLATKIM